MLGKFTGCYAKSADAMERLRLLLKTRSHYEESVGAIEVIGCQEKSVVAMKVTCCIQHKSLRTIFFCTVPIF
jgi:hypothetical protein